MKSGPYLAVVLVLLCQSLAAAQERHPQVIMETSLGTVRLELFADKAPVSVKNFLQYVPPVEMGMQLKGATIGD